MSAQHPIIAVTGSSGAGTTTVKAAFDRIFEREGIHPAVIEGDSFHRYNRLQMVEAQAVAQSEGRRITHFGPEGNLFDELLGLFREYAEHGTGRRRRYIHTEAEAEESGHPAGTFTPWEQIPDGTDLLVYEGLHGGLVTPEYNIPGWVDLLIGVVPIVNLEWIQKMHRDRAVRGYSVDAAMRLILFRMYDYVTYIVPQFSLTDVNFQRVPLVDTSNPFALDPIPTDVESVWVIHVRNQQRLQVDFEQLLAQVPGSYLSRRDTVVVPGSRKVQAMDYIITPEVRRLIRHRRRS
jgi:phosphoribulokinase